MKNLNQFYLQLIIMYYLSSLILKSLKMIQIMNFHKICFLQFTPKNGPEIDLDIRYASKLISQEYDT